MLCEYCGKTLSNIKTLKYHQKTSKQCKLYRNKCYGCEINFNTDRELRQHKLSCIPIIKNKIRMECREEFQQEIIELKEEIKKLKNEIEHHSTVNLNITNNELQIMIDKLEPIDPSQFKNYIHNLTIYHVLQGIRGYALYASQFVFKNKIICTDFARRKILYKDINGNIQRDVGMNPFTTDFFKSIFQRNYDLAMEYQQTHFNKEDYDKILQYEMGFVQRGASGCLDSKQHNTFIKEFCSEILLK